LTTLIKYFDNFAKYFKKLLTFTKNFDKLCHQKEIYMARKVLEKCPSCGSDLEVTRMSCTACETVILGRYESCRFCKLSPDSLQFLESFIKNRGNIKQMEREVGESYWTIRARLNEIIQEMGFEVEPTEADDESSVERREVLEQLNRGEISASDAAEKLARLKR
jgi:hypothetical protein